MGCTQSRQMTQEQLIDGFRMLQKATKEEEKLCKEDFQSLKPINGNFLGELFRQLSKKKANNLQKPLKISVQKGFSRIPIQELQPRKFIKPSRSDGRFIFQKLGSKLLSYQQSCQLSYLDQNGFFKAFFDAYIFHGDVKVTPDDVWLTIMLFFSQYVNLHAEELRKAFVSHQGKKKLTITTNNNQNDWSSFFQQVIVEVKKQTTQAVTDNLLSDFSTTDSFYKVMSTATIMNAYQKYFDYERQMCICGIQNIHMSGDLQDWQKIMKKTEFLKQFDVQGTLKKYVDRLLPVIYQFIQTFKGNPNVLFWNNIYHQRHQPFERAYQPRKFITGGIIRFFTTEDELGDKIKAQRISVPIKIVNQLKKTQKQVILVGGCQGV